MNRNSRPHFGQRTFSPSTCMSSAGGILYSQPGQGVVRSNSNLRRRGMNEFYREGQVQHTAGYIQRLRGWE